MRVIALLVLAIAWLPCLANSSDLQALIESHQQKYHVGLEVYHPKSGQYLYQTQINTPFHPASGTKLFTSFAALKTLGRSFQFRTTLNYIRAIENGVLSKDVGIVFSGDPYLSFQDYQQFIEHLVDQGVTSIEGDFILDDSDFAGPAYAPGWTWEDFDWGFAPPVLAYSLNKNMVKLFLHSPKKHNLPFRIEAKSSLPLTVHNYVQAVPKQQVENCALSIQQRGFSFLLQGCWRSSRQPQLLELANKDLPQFLPLLIEKLLRDHQIDLKGKVRFGMIEAPEQKAHLSSPLPTLLQDTLNHSDNLVAECLLKSMGLKQFGVGSFHFGVKALKQTLAQSFNWQEDDLAFFDGSGLSQYNFVTPHQMTELLTQIYHDSDYAILKDSMSVYQKSGKLKDRSPYPELTGKVFAKTGTLTGHSTLSGYIENHQGEPLVFSLFINNAREKRATLKKLEDDILLQIWQLSLEAT